MSEGSNGKYTAKYFADSMPDWKKKKDNLMSRLLWRRVSFVLAAMAANRGITANSVSYFSSWVAIVACGMFMVQGRISHVMGALLMIVWLVLDCVDGNLARGVKKQPFGEFADSMSSYLLIGFVCTGIGTAAYFEGGLFVEAGDPWMIVMGALASSSDTMMRLIYQKFKNTEKRMAEQGLIQVERDFRAEGDQKLSLKAFVDRELGLVTLPEFVLLAAIFGWLDLVVIYAFCFYVLALLANIFIYVRKAIKAAKENE